MAASHEPWVESRRWRIPRRRNSAATAARSARRRPRTRSRSRRSAVSTRRRAARLGIDQGQLADVDEGSPRAGRSISMARTVWRADDVGQRPAPVERAAEVGDDRHEAGRGARGGHGPQRVGDGRRRRRPPRAVRRRAPGAGRACRCGHRPAGGPPGCARPPKAMTPSRSRASGDEAPDDEGGALGDVGLAPVGRPEVHRGGAVEQQPRGELAIGHVLADLRDAAARGGVPVDAADVVARLVRPDAVEVQAVAEAAGRGGRRRGEPPARRVRAISSRRTRSSAIGPGPGRAALRSRPASRARSPPRVGSAVMPWRRPGGEVELRRGHEAEDAAGRPLSGVMPSVRAA